MEGVFNVPVKDTDDTDAVGNLNITTPSPPTGAKEKSPFVLVVKEYTEEAPPPAPPPARFLPGKRPKLSPPELPPPPLPPTPGLFAEYPPAPPPAK